MSRLGLVIAGNASCTLYLIRQFKHGRQRDSLHLASGCHRVIPPPRHQYGIPRSGRVDTVSIFSDFTPIMCFIPAHGVGFTNNLLSLLPPVPSPAFYFIFFSSLAFFTHLTPNRKAIYSLLSSHLSSIFFFVRTPTGSLISVIILFKTPALTFPFSYYLSPTLANIRRRDEIQRFVSHPE